MASSPTTPPPVSFTSAKPKTKSTTATTTNTTPSFRLIPAISAAATIFLYQRRRRRRCYSFQEVAQLHAQLTVSGLLPTTAGMLIESYLSVSHVNHASLVFDTMPHPDVFAYNIMIRGLTDHNQPYHSLLLFRKMILLDGLIPDTYTYTCVLKACSHHTNTRSFLFQGKQVHCRVIKAGIPPHTHVHSSLIHMYSNSDCLDSAELVLKECTGCQDQNTSISNSMISGYLRHGCIGKAKQLFDETTRKDVASWSAVVSGYTRNGMYMEALNVFREMMVQGVQPNESTVVSALSACARIGALDLGRWIHKYVDYKIGAANLSVRLGTSLVDMYAKCGNIDASYEVFKSMVRAGRDVVTWGAMISGFAIHGQAEKCFELFNKMIYDGICPNEIIFVAILSACSHVGYVEEGHRYFNQMVERFGVNPSVEHYGCMVDLLGRAGQLAEAEELISSMPVEPNSVVWGSLLASCRTHKDIQRGKRAFRCLTELDPKSGDRHKLAGHMFAAAGELEEAVKVRKLIKEKEMETTRGSSFIEVDGMVHEFVVGDTSHSEAREIYAVLKGIMKQTYCQEKDKEDCCFKTSEQRGVDEAKEIYAVFNGGVCRFSDNKVSSAARSANEQEQT